MGGAAIGLLAGGIGAVGSLVVVTGFGASAISEAVGEMFAGAGEVMKNQAVQVGGAMADGAVRFGRGVADGAVQVGQVVGGWWGKVTRKMKGE